MAVEQTLASARSFPQRPQIHCLYTEERFPFSSPRVLLANNKSRLNFHISTRLRCSLDNHNQVAFPKPSEIPWRKELSNSVQLIGVVGKLVDIKHLPSGKAVAWTRLGVKKSATNTCWINLTFWDELAHVAFQHVEKGHQIYVSGRLVSDTVENEEGKEQTYYKVVVQQLNFVERNFTSMAFHDHDSDYMTAGRRLGNSTTNDKGPTEELWQAFFANPVDWWDNRNNKRNPKYPDFKHKDTGEALWVEGRNNPPWVKSQLAILDARMGSIHGQDAGIHPHVMVGDELLF